MIRSIEKSQANFCFTRGFEMKFQPMDAPFPGQRMWGARSDIGSYMIVEDDGLYTASARRIGGKTEFIIPHSAGVMTFEEAQDACVKHAHR